MKWNNLKIISVPKPTYLRIPSAIAHCLYPKKTADILDMVNNLRRLAPTYYIEHIKSKEYKHVHVDLPSRLD